MIILRVLYDFKGRIHVYTLQSLQEKSELAKAEVKAWLCILFLPGKESAQYRRWALEENTS